MVQVGQRAFLEQVMENYYNQHQPTPPPTKPTLEVKQPEIGTVGYIGLGAILGLALGYGIALLAKE